MLRFNFAGDFRSFLELHHLTIGFLSILIMLITMHLQTKNIKERIANLKRQVIEVNVKKQYLANINNSISTLEKEKTSLRKELAKMQVKQTSSGKVPWFLKFVYNSTNIPDGLWLYSVKYKNNKVTFKGGCYNLKTLSKFVSRLRNQCGEVNVKRVKFVPNTKKPFYKYVLSVNNRGCF